MGMKLIHISSEQAAQFYAIHRGKPFFNDLIDFMSSGKIVVLALEADDCINRWRRLMGATDPEKADAGTIRKLYGTAVNRNACHGSDAAETAEVELKFFFSSYELIS
jgi:nucleoside-diphosphate kinase